MWFIHCHSDRIRARDSATATRPRRVQVQDNFIRHSNSRLIHTWPSYIQCYARNSDQLVLGYISSIQSAIHSHSIRPRSPSSRGSDNVPNNIRTEEIRKPSADFVAKQFNHDWSQSRSCSVGPRFNPRDHHTSLITVTRQCRCLRKGPSSLDGCAKQLRTQTYGLGSYFYGSSGLSLNAWYILYIIMQVTITNNINIISNCSTSAMSSPRVRTAIRSIGRWHSVCRVTGLPSFLNPCTDCNILIESSLMPMSNTNCGCKYIFALSRKYTSSYTSPR